MSLLRIRYGCGCYADLADDAVKGVVYCQGHTWALPMRRRCPTLEEMSKAFGVGQIEFRAGNGHL